MARNLSAKAFPDFGFPACYGVDLPDLASDMQRGLPFNPTGQCDPEEFVGAVANLPSHCAALGMRFYNESLFPARYQGRAFIAEHGSWNRWPPSGYSVSTVAVGDPTTATAGTGLGKPLGMGLSAEDASSHVDANYEEFLTGFRRPHGLEIPCTTSAQCPGNSTCQTGAPNDGPTRLCGGRGRPVDVEVMRDGSILISDDMNSLIYRVTYLNKDQPTATARFFSLQEDGSVTVHASVAELLTMVVAALLVLVLMPVAVYTAVRNRQRRRNLGINVSLKGKKGEEGTAQGFASM
jgi:hypothetical protein